jgi:hypothetical protein
MQKESENQQLLFDELSSVKFEMSEVTKKLDKKVEVLEFTKILKTKAPMGDVDEISDSLRKIERVYF